MTPDQVNELVVNDLVDLLPVALLLAVCWAAVLLLHEWWTEED